MHAALGGWSMTLRWCVSSSIRHVTFQRPMISIYNRKGCGLARCCVRVRLTCTCIVRTYPAHLSLSLVLPHIHSSRCIMYVRFVTGHACVQRQLLYSITADCRRRRNSIHRRASSRPLAFWLLVVTYCLLVTEQKKLYFL